MKHFLVLLSLSSHIYSLPALLTAVNLDSFTGEQNDDNRIERPARISLSTSESSDFGVEILVDAPSPLEDVLQLQTIKLKEFRESKLAPASRHYLSEYMAIYSRFTEIVASSTSDLLHSSLFTSTTEAYFSKHINALIFLSKNIKSNIDAYPLLFKDTIKEFTSLSLQLLSPQEYLTSILSEHEKRLGPLLNIAEDSDVNSLFSSFRFSKYKQQTKLQLFQIYLGIFQKFSTTLSAYFGLEQLEAIEAIEPDTPRSISSSMQLSDVAITGSSILGVNLISRIDTLLFNSAHNLTFVLPIDSKYVVGVLHVISLAFEKLYDSLLRASESITRVFLIYDALIDLLHVKNEMISTSKIGWVGKVNTQEEKVNIEWYLIAFRKMRDKVMIIFEDLNENAMIVDDVLLLEVKTLVLRNIKVFKNGISGADRELVDAEFNRVVAVVQNVVNKSMSS